jgi:thiol-disulfide isomerase/thioredoxin
MKKIYAIILFLFLLVGLSILIAGEKQSSGDEIKVETIKKEGLDKLIKDRNGKVLFLNFWATWCVPCREEFPDIVKLSEEYQNKNLDVVAISVDYPDEVESKIIPFLKKMNAKFTVYVNGFEKDDELIDTMGNGWWGAVPATFIIDKNGKVVKLLNGKRSYKDFKKEIDSVLNN